ncbi:hypothetical protein [Fodinibius halophilus]|uniref:DUF2314 domain-containing protein n=1 Tax=Fodinibius halophilus TaxID=1736908 RepID=A0A6M1T5Z4_9BACT|nr:hypothetical protein [Fodinibius halophilus]NGP88705.1 hypothetical protein [Fodinibius halophilus]
MFNQFLFEDSYRFEWIHLIGIPIGIMVALGFIKYGWRWIRNIIDITADDYLSPQSRYYKKAVRQAQEYLNSFLHHVNKGEKECFAKFPLEVAPEHIERVWAIVHYFDEQKQQFNVSVITETTDVEIASGRKFISPEQLEDWQVLKGERILGFYTYLARIKKAKSEGFRLNYKSKQIAESIIQ